MTIVSNDVLRGNENRDILYSRDEIAMHEGDEAVIEGKEEGQLRWYQT